MSAWTEIALFAGKTVILIGMIGVLAAFIAVLVARARDFRPDFEVEDLNHTFKDLELSLQQHLLTAKETKKLFKSEKKREKAESKDESKKARTFVLDFDGDVRASAVENLRKEISAILTVAQPGTDELLLRLESPGGMVHAYGLAASQLDRVRQRGLKLTICVDKIAASGGYMMAVLGTKILAAPFAIVGSVGVVAQVPNFHRLLKKNDVDYQELTAGEYKRTISMLGEITEKGKAKFVEQLEDTHLLFKEFVSRYRPQMDIAKVATGEYWYGERALTLGLVDELKTSDDYLFHLRDERKLLKIKFAEKKKISDKLAELLESVAHRLFARWQKLESEKQFPS